MGATEPHEKTRNPLSGLGKREMWLLPILTRNTPALPVDSPTLFTTFFNGPFFSGNVG